MEVLMKLSSRALGLSAIAATVLASAGVATAASGASPKSTTCPPVTGVKWVLPYAPHSSGTKYDLHVSGSKLTCKQAAKDVKKLVATHLRTSGPLPGGPKGWKCIGSPDKNGHPYMGTCQPKSEGFVPRDSFTWTVG
jgi:hypothetical protein